jgi:hypothetical protein
LLLVNRAGQRYLFRVLHLRKLAVLVSIVLLTVTSPSPLNAQTQPGISPPINSSLLKLFGTNTAFSAAAHVRVTDENQKEFMTAPLNLTFLEGKLRADLDLKQLRSTQLPAELLAQLRQIKMDQVTSIVRIDRNAILLVYPELKSYVEMPVPKDETMALDKATLTKTPFGTEIIDGKKCAKTKAVLTDRTTRSEMMLWAAPERPDFPIQIQMTENGYGILLKLQNVRFARPEAKQFEAPAGFQKFETVQRLLVQAMISGVTK